MRFSKVSAADATAVRNRAARSKVDLSEYTTFMRPVVDGDLVRIEIDVDVDKKYTVTSHVKAAAFELSKEPTFYAGKPNEVLFDLKPLTDARRAEIVKARADRNAELKSQRAEKLAATAAAGAIVAKPAPVA